MKKIYLLSFCALASSLLYGQDKSDSSEVLAGVVVRSPFSGSVKSPVTISQLSRKDIVRKNYGQEVSVIDYIVVSGNWEERFETAKQIIKERFFK